MWRMWTTPASSCSCRTRWVRGTNSKSGEERVDARGGATPCCCGNRPGWGGLDGLGRLWDEHDVIAQVAQALDQPGGGALARDLIKVALAEVTEGLAGGEHVEGGDEQLVSHGHESPHGPAAATQAVILVTIVAAFGPHRSRGSGEQYRLQEHVAPAHGRSLRLAGALVVSR